MTQWTSRRSALATAFAIPDVEIPSCRTCRGLAGLTPLLGRGGAYWDYFTESTTYYGKRANAGEGECVEVERGDFSSQRRNGRAPHPDPQHRAHEIINQGIRLHGISTWWTARQDLESRTKQLKALAFKRCPVPFLFCKQQA